MYANGAEYNLASTTSRYMVAAAFVLLLYVSVLVHELAHCVVARAFSLPVRRVLLYPLGGYSEIEQEPQTPGREALISGAGPAVSLAIAGLGYGLAKIVPAGLTHQLIAQLFVANLIVGIFNLLPGLPAGRRPGLPCRRLEADRAPAGTATTAAAWAGRVLAIALVGLALFSQRAGGRSSTWPGCGCWYWPGSSGSSRPRPSGPRRSGSGCPPSAPGVWPGRDPGPGQPAAVRGGPPRPGGWRAGAGDRRSRGHADRPGQRGGGAGHPGGAAALDRGRLAGQVTQPRARAARPTRAGWT